MQSSTESATPYYTVMVTFGIGAYVGDCDGNEPKMEEQYTLVCKSPSRKYAELVYKRLVAAPSDRPTEEQ